VARNADLLSFNYTALPQDMTVYVKGEARGAIAAAASFPEILSIGTGSDIDLYLNAGAAVAEVRNPSAVNVTSAALSSSAAFELAAKYRNWSTGASVAVDMGAGYGSFSAAAVGALAAFSATTIRLGIGSNTQGVVAFQAIRIAAGLQTLAAMQTMVYDSGWIASYPSGHTAETLQGMNVAFVQIVNGQTGFTGQYWSVQIDDASNAAGYVELARLCVCGGWQPDGNAQYGLEQRWDSPTTAEETDAASFIYNARPGRRLFAYTLPMMLDADTLSYPWRMQRILGKSGQFLFVFDPTDSANMHERACLCVFEDLSPLKYAFLGRQDVPLGIREEL
jgi:hypothetical protein